MSELIPRWNLTNKLSLPKKRELRFENQTEEYEAMGWLGFRELLAQILQVGSPRYDLQKDMQSGLGEIMDTFVYRPSKLSDFCSKKFKSTTNLEYYQNGDRFVENKKIQQAYLRNLCIVTKPEGQSQYTIDPMLKTSLKILDAGGLEKIAQDEPYGLGRHAENINLLASFYYAKINKSVLDPISDLERARQEIEYYIGAYDPAPNNDIYYQN